MGSSLVLTGGAAVTKTLKEAITQIGHGFTVGSVIRWDSVSSPPKYVLAVADSAQNAEVAGVVNLRSDADNFEVTYHGYIDLPQFSGISAPVLFLSSEQGGSLGINPPSAVGTVIKPVLTRNTNSSGHLVMNYLGTQIGGSSTISVDEIQPVGTIMPYAGTAIPDTWLACDGNSYATSQYPELYSKLCYATGERAPMYGHIVDIAPSSGTIATTEWTASAVGDYIYIKNRTTTAGGGTPDVNTEASYDFLGRIIAKGTLPSNPAAQGWTVRILGKYNSTSKRFEMPNAFVLSESGTNFSSSVRVYATVATGPRGSGGSINTASAVAFNTPNLRGRFLFGEVGSGEIIPDADPNTLSTFAYDYPMASWGGEERHVITTAEMPAHKHKFVDWGGSQFAPAGTQYDLQTQATGNYGYADTDTKPSYGNANDSGPSAVGGDAAHNNMPPYLAVRYIIKAKPYTRAAIVDGIDLPYSNLLVRDLRSRNVGGSNGDLVFHTNTSGDSGNGTERMRLSTDGTLTIKGVGANDQLPELRVQDSAASRFLDLHSSVGNGSWNSLNQAGSSSIVYGLVTGVNSGATLTICPWSNASNSGLVLSSSATETRVGIGTNAPGASLDVNGTLKVGNFGGATNVMVKPSNTTPGAVGYVQPIVFSYSGNSVSRGIPAGTWFVCGEWIENTNTSYDNDPTVFMAKVWTVPTGKYLHIATDDQLWSQTDTQNGGKINLHWKLSNNATETISGAVSTWGTGWNTFVIPPTSNPSATTVGSDAVTAMSSYINGYAEYDTYGVRGAGNNTPLGAGYGYIQRLS